jgi:hypothetical protein
MPKPNFIPQKEQKWIKARAQFHLSHAHIQMARELGMNPDGFGKLANHRQQPWKTPLPEFIEDLYFKRFKKTRPDVVKTIEQLVKAKRAKKAAKKAGPSTANPESESLDQKAETPSSEEASPSGTTLP